MDEQKDLKPFDKDFEDGELSDSDEGYTPLQRPGTTTNPIEVTPPQTDLNIPVKMEEAIEESASDDFGASSSSSSDSDDCTTLGKSPDEPKKPQKKKSKRTVLLRIKAENERQDKKTRFKKYDIWASSLQEDALTENMRGIGVHHDNRCNRSVESYDYMLKYRLNRKNSLKRRLSTSSDEHSENDYHQQAKRSRAGGVKSRLGRRSNRPSESSSDYANEQRHIFDLDEPLEGKPPHEIAREIANKLYEDKDDLLVRVVEVLGRDLLVQIFKETQRIEKDGGMMILNGKRRRTPGGVFLFLVKKHDRITPDEKKIIFYDEQKVSCRVYKEQQAMKRHRKVEELKKRLSAKEKNLPALASTRTELFLGSELKPDPKSTLSNPPPSPVGQDNSPDYKSHAINHVGCDASPDKPCTSKDIALDMDPVSYDDDCLDINCDMEFF